MMYEFEIGLAYGEESWSCTIKSNKPEDELNKLWTEGYASCTNAYGVLEVDNLYDLGVINQDDLDYWNENNILPLNAAFRLIVGLAKLVDPTVEAEQLN